VRSFLQLPAQRVVKADAHIAGQFDGFAIAENFDGLFRLIDD
jgi:hypothetical protein